MNHRIFGAILTLPILFLVSGCTTQTIRPISQQVIIEDEENRSTIIDVKLAKYTELAKDFPKEARYQEKLARLHWEKNDHKMSLKALARAKKLDPDNPRYNYLEAQVFEGIGSYSAAEKAYLAVIEATSSGTEYSGPSMQLGLLYMQMERSDKAFTCFKNALEADPTFPEPHYWIGRVQMMHKDRKEAILSFERYIRIGGQQRYKEVMKTLQALQPDLRIHDIR
ncbi:MAG: tetratricopeptide repeat protein [Planctomycetota bacterium]|nr:tetratricopeptide repeat protein [Planctomycetota bacterium]